MRRFLRDNSLSIVFLLLFLAALGGPGDRGARRLQRLRAEPWRPDDLARPLCPVVRLRHRGDGELAVRVPPVHAHDPAHGLAVQRGSPESKELDKAGRESDQSQKVGPYAQQNSPRWAKVAGIRRTLYENSLVLVMGMFWLGTWLAQSITGRRAVQRGAARPPPGRAELVALHQHRELLGEHASELAVGVPRGGLDGDPRGVPAPARIARVEAGRGAAQRHGRGGLKARNGSGLKPPYRHQRFPREMHLPSTQSRRRRRGNGPDPHTGPDGPAPVVLLALASRARARHRLDPRRPRGHDRASAIGAPLTRRRTRRPHRSQLASPLNLRVGSPAPAL